MPQNIVHVVSLYLNHQMSERWECIQSSQQLGQHAHVHFSIIRVACTEFEDAVLGGFCSVTCMVGSGLALVTQSACIVNIAPNCSSCRLLRRGLLHLFDLDTIQGLLQCMDRFSPSSILVGRSLGCPPRRSSRSVLLGFIFICTWVCYQIPTRVLWSVAFSTSRHGCHSLWVVIHTLKVDLGRSAATHTSCTGFRARGLHSQHSARVHRLHRQKFTPSLKFQHTSCTRSLQHIARRP